MEAQLKASEEDGDRLRTERERLRDRLSELQATLKEKEAEVRIGDGRMIVISIATNRSH